VREYIEAALQPARMTTQALKRGEAPPPALADFRKLPLGVDSGGLVYWYLDLGNATGAPRCDQITRGSQFVSYFVTADGAVHALSGHLGHGA